MCGLMARVRICVSACVRMRVCVRVRLFLSILCFYPLFAASLLICTLRSFLPSVKRSLLGIA